MAIILDGTTGITAPDITSAAGLDAADLTGTVASARLPAGSVLQIQEGTIQAWATTSSTFVETGLNVDITPKQLGSKIFIDVMIGGLYFPQPGYTIQVRRTGGVVVGPHNQQVYGYGNTGASGYTRMQGNYNISDTPNTTNAIRYSLWIYSQNGTSIEIGNAASFSTIRATEVAV